MLYYSSKTLSDQFHSYLIRSRIIVYTNHAALKYILPKKDLKDRLIHLLQEFELKKQVNKGVDYLLANHLFCLPNTPFIVYPINESFSNK